MPVPSQVMTWSHQRSGKKARRMPASSGVGARRLAVPRITSGSMGRFGAGTLRTGFVGIAPSSSASSSTRNRIERDAMTVCQPVVAWSRFCQRRTKVGLMERICWRSKNGRTCLRYWILVVSIVLGLRSGLDDHRSHHVSPHSPNGRLPFCCELQPLLGREQQRLVLGADGLAALGAVVQPPVNQVALPALAPVHRRHDDLAPIVGERDRSGPATWNRRPTGRCRGGKRAGRRGDGPGRTPGPVRGAEASAGVHCPVSALHPAGASRTLTRRCRSGWWASPPPPRAWGVVTAVGGCRRGGVITVTPPTGGVMTVTTPPVTVGEGVSATLTTPPTGRSSTAPAGRQPLAVEGVMVPTSAFGRGRRPAPRRPGLAWPAR